jgi:peptidylprolyl isomerase
VSVLALALAAGACGSTPTSTAGAPKRPAASRTAGPVAPTPTTASTAAAGLPAVSGATDLRAEPRVAAGTAPAPTTLLTKDLVVGTGATAHAGSSVVVQYVGANYATGTVFDASWTDHGPAEFSLSGVVPGFAEGIEGMKVGGRREIVIPAPLGYGAAGQPPAVGPNETLVFVVDLLGVG